MLCGLMYVLFQTGESRSCCGALGRRSAATCADFRDAFCPCCNGKNEKEQRYAENGHSNPDFPDVEFVNAKVSKQNENVNGFT